MFIGLDFGTSQCAVTVATPDGPVAVPLEAQQAYLPSCLYAPERCLIADFVANSNIHGKAEYVLSRRIPLQLAQEAKINLSIRDSREALLFGTEALAQHMADPTDGYFIKSPKSFLGASGLRDDMVNFFEDVVTAMLLEIKQRSEAFLNAEILGAVIGRPINFQGINSETSNQQAINILETSAKRAGFLHIEFLYEPLAAGFDFERTLTEDKTVLVVDIGGGTTDCSMVRMGPNHRSKSNRQEDVLAHTGERIGGNDFDISLAREALMPHYGMKSLLKNGLPMPLVPFYQATAVNDVAAQSSFYSDKMRETLEQLCRDTTEPVIFQRFKFMRAKKNNFALVRMAELAKIDLSEREVCELDLCKYTPDLKLSISTSLLIDASKSAFEKILHLAQDAVKQAQLNPEVIFITGGSSKSRFLKHALAESFGAHSFIMEGDHFGSVVHGLGIQAKKLINKTHN